MHVFTCQEIQNSFSNLDLWAVENGALTCVGLKMKAAIIVSLIT